MRVTHPFFILKSFIKHLISQLSNKKDYSKFKRLQHIIQYHFNNQEILYAALSHTSFNSLEIPTSFERMEFLGDSILGLTIAEELFAKYPSYSEGQLSKLKSKIVSKKFLFLKAKEIHLGDYMLLSPEAIQSGGRDSASILTDSMESLICAIYLDSNMTKAKKFIKQFILEDFQKHIQKEELTNYKSILQEYSQLKYQETPNYIITDEKGPDHEKIFSVEVYIKNKKLGFGKGPNKKEAQQNAAKKACLELNL